MSHQSRCHVILELLQGPPSRLTFLLSIRRFGIQQQAPVAYNQYAVYETPFRGYRQEFLLGLL